MNFKTRSVTWGLLLWALFPRASYAAEDLFFLNNAPEVRAQLLRWEREAPEDVKAKILILRTGEAGDKAYTAYDLGKIGPSSKGSTLALMETLRDGTALEWRSGGALGPRTSPAEEAVGALGRIGLSAVGPLVAALRDADSRVREGAIEALSQIDSRWRTSEAAKRAVPEFSAGLKNLDSGVRSGSAWALGRIQDSRAVEPLTEALKDPDSDVRQQSARALGQILDPRAVEPLTVALEDPDSNVRKESAEALGRLRDSMAAEFLISRLRDKDWEVRSEAANALVQLDPRWRTSEVASVAVSEFIAALNDRYPAVRSKAARALGKIKDPRAVEPLISALTDRDAGVREEAAVALGKLQDSRAIQPLIATLRDGKQDVRGRAEEALGLIDPKWKSSEAASRAIPEFILALKDESSNVRLGAANALGELKDPRAVDSLIDCLIDPDLFVREHAEEALGLIDPEWKSSEAASRAIPEFILALKDESPDVRRGAVEALDLVDSNWRGSEAASRAVPEFIDELKGPNLRAHTRAAWALGQIRDPRAVEPLITALKDQKWNGRKAAWALGQLRDSRAVEPLMAKLMDSDPELRSEAVDALGEIDPKWRSSAAARMAVPALIGGLTHSNWSVRQGAAWALGQIEVPRKAAVEPLISLLKDEDSNVRGAAAQALRNITGQPFGAVLEDWARWYAKQKK